MAPVIYKIKALSTGLPEAIADRIRRFNESPATRSTASFLLNKHANGVIREAQIIADGQFHTERDDARRPPKSRAHGLHYRDSFVKTPNTQDSIGKFETRIVNTHPAANLIEWGAKAHTMPAKAAGGFAKAGEPIFGPGGSDDYIFPEEFPHSPASLNSPGDWPANFGEGAFFGPGPIDHPGHIAFHIFKRARARWHAQNR